MSGPESDPGKPSIGQIRERLAMAGNQFGTAGEALRNMVHSELDAVRAQTSRGHELTSKLGVTLGAIERIDTVDIPTSAGAATRTAEVAQRGLATIVRGSNNARLSELPAQGARVVEAIGAVAAARFAELTDEAQSYVARLNEIFDEINGISATRDQELDLIASETQIIRSDCASIPM